MTHWAIKWRSENKLDGRRGHLMGHYPLTVHGMPILFATKAEAQAYIRVNYGYIATRPDLRREPHGWKMPIAVRVTVTVKEVTATKGD